MNPERWAKIEDIFQSALDLSGAEREEFVRAECGDDAELLSEVRKFIARYETEDTFLESPVWTDSLLMQPSLKQQIASSLEKDLPPTRGVKPVVGRSVGVYRLTKEIGKGGMGVVYEAERADGEFYQKVAIKLIKRGMDTDFIIKRFRHERQIAATLNHPNIARLLDGGTTEDNLPYFVMEFIKGEPLYKFCEKNHLAIPERLKIFQQICSAVCHAHGKHIIHRDIKPGNILISDEGTPKLLDFGIAKILDPDLIHESVMPTATQMRLMTPEYASPEQVKGEDITPASDQYSLGVLLYELVTGARPYKFSSRAPHDIARVICEEEPLRPSSQISQASAGKISTGGKQKQSFNGDASVDESLENIILKSLRKNPSDRYASVAEFSADIERYLNHQPIRAESPTTGKNLFARVAPEKSIAVLPLKIINTAAGTGEDAFLSVGLADALITRLSNMRQFVVRPTSSVLPYGARTCDSFAAGEELNVHYVLDGNIIKTDSRIRISVQLLDVAAQSTVWAERFDANLNDVLNLEDTISARVAESLVPQLTTGEVENLARRGTDDAAAYEAYLRGRAIWNNFTEDAMRRALNYYQEAIRLDANYAAAHAAVADYYVWLGMYSLVPADEFYPSAKQAALRAIELDSNSSEAHAALGLTELYGKYDWTESEKNMRRAIELNPNNSVAHLWFTHNLYTQGKFIEGAKHLDRAIELDPSSLQNHNTKAWGFYFERRFDKAIVKADDLIERFPTISHSYFAKSMFLRMVGRTDESLRFSERALEFSGDALFTFYGHASALAAAGRRAEALEIIENTPPSTYLSDYHTAIVYCFLKDKERAFERLERAFEMRESTLVWLGVEPSLDFLRDDARYLHLLEKINHPTLKTIYRNPTEHRTLVKKFDSKSGLPAPVSNQKSIAVLPFKILNKISSEMTDDGEFLGVGLADALITRLSGIRQLIVRPTNSVLPYGKEDEDSFAAGRELGVGYILDGGILVVGKRIRISVQLLDVAAQSTVWAERFDQDFNGVLQLEDAISSRVAELLVPQLTTGEIENLAKRGTDNMQAYEAYLRGRFHWTTLSEDGFRQAIFFYTKAIELDPNYAVAHAGIADYYIWLGVYGVLPPKECYPPAKDAARRAIELDDQLAEAYASLGFAELCGDLNWLEAEKNMLRAIQLNPNYAVGRIWYSYLLSTDERFGEGIEQARRAVELDPQTYTNYNTFAWSFYFARRYDEALRETKRCIEKFSDNGLAYFTRSWALRAVGRTHEAVKAAEKAVRLSGESLFALLGLAQTLAADGRREEAEEVLKKVEAAGDKQYVSYYHVAIVYCFLKNREKALDALERTWADNEGWLIWLRVEPAFDILRDEPRFVRLAEKVERRSPKNLSGKITGDEISLKDSNAGGRISSDKIISGRPSSQKSFEAGKPTLDDQSIAVLPFKILEAASSANEDTSDNAFLGIGLADALITRLSNVQRLAVRPTSSVLRYGREGADSFKAGDELNVKYILDGNIIKANKRIRVSVQLLNVVKHSVVWAERFDENSVDVLSLEDTISAKVVESLVPQLTTGEREKLAKRGTDNAAAYESYLRGRFHWNTFTEEGFAKAFVAYHEAIAHDPNYALAHAGIADYYIWLGIYGVLSPKDSYLPAQKSAERAIEINPKLAEAYAALGFAQLCGNFDWEESEKNVRYAIELSPNYAVAHNWLAICLLTGGRFEEAIKHARRSIELDPLTYQNHRTLAWGYYFSRRFEEALVQVDRTIEKFPMLGTAHFNRSWLLRSMGKTDEALESSETAIERSNGSVFILLGHAQALAAAGKLDEAETLIEEVKAQNATRYICYYHIALAYCYAREKEKTFVALEQAWKDREGWLAWLAVEPAFDYVRQEPRFIEILQRVQPPEITAKSDSALNLISDADSGSSQISVADSTVAYSAPMPTAERIVLARRAGIKQGIFLIIVSFLLIPILVMMASIEFFDATHLLLVFFLVFGGGLARIIYAFFFEPKYALATEQADNPASNIDVPFSSRPTVIAGENQQDAKDVRANDLKRRLPKFFLSVLAAISLLAVGYGAYHIYSHSTFSLTGNAPRPEDNWRNTFASVMSVKRLTTSGKEQFAAISPDGKQIAFISEKDKMQGLWIRPVDSDNAVQLVATTGVLYVGLTFSPDGKFIYYTIFGQEFIQRMLWRVPIDGGAPQKILDDVNSNVSLSADGRHLAYNSYDRSNKTLNLIVAELKEDGTLQSLKNVSTLLQPNYFSGSPGLSPDGSKIAYGIAAVDGQKTTVNFFVYDLKAGAEQRLVAKDFNDIFSAVWRENGNEIIISANEKNTDPLQLYLVAYPSGEVSRLTNDLNSYYGVSLTKNSDALVTAQKETVSSVAVMSWEGERTFVNMIIDDASRQDGIAGVQWTADNRILYIASVDGKNSIVLVNADETNSRTINVGDALPVKPFLSGDGRFLFFIDENGQESKLRRYEMATATLTEITPQAAMNPTLTPDNRFIIYTAFNSKRNTILYRVPVEGGEPVELTSLRAFNAVVSPDNRFIACYFSDEAGSQGWQIGIFPIEGGSPGRVIKPTDTVYSRGVDVRRMAWSADGKWLYYINDKGGNSNIYRVTTDGQNKTEQVTKLPSGIIFDFALAPDGKRAVVARGSTTSDIVIFRSSK